MAREVGFKNINLDLMFGIPDQTMAVWEKTLSQVIDLRPEHISAYSLQLEEGTPYYRQYKEEQLPVPSNTEERKMYHIFLEKIKETGYEHYEISNCALPGYKCLHNLKYWSFDAYCGVGLGAHSFHPTHDRISNPEDLNQYIAGITDGNLPIDMKRHHISTEREAMGEYVFTGLRKVSGINTTDFHQTFGQDFFEVYKDIDLDQYQKQGFLVLKDNRLALTENGIDHSNFIMAEFV
jgi:oxygen-independent coproporphyrinogen-3 oxidase